MGLDTSHDCWHGPYSAFTRWRNTVAKAAGYDVKPEADPSGFTFETAQIDWASIERDNPGCYMGEWRTSPDDPLVYLIAHSDCDGEIKPEQAAPLADRLEALLPSIPVNIGHDRPRWAAERFIRGLRRAVKAGEAVEFR